MFRFAPISIPQIPPQIALNLIGRIFMQLALSISLKAGDEFGWKIVLRPENWTQNRSMKEGDRCSRRPLFPARINFGWGGIVKG